MCICWSSCNLTLGCSTHKACLFLPSVLLGLSVRENVLNLGSIKAKRGKAAPWALLGFWHQISGGIGASAHPSCILLLEVKNWQAVPTWHWLWEPRCPPALEWALEELCPDNEVKHEAGPVALCLLWSQWEQCQRLTQRECWDGDRVEEQQSLILRSWDRTLPKNSVF